MAEEVCNIFNRIQDVLSELELYEEGERAELSTEHAHLLSSVILLHIAFVDLSYTEEEEDALIAALVQQANISEGVARRVIEVADVVRIKSGRLSSFLEILQEQLSLEQRMGLYGSCWTLIRADGIIQAVELQAATELGKRLGLSAEQELEARARLV